ncbi:MAG: DUF1292 domain-containing protein [Erysipelotrichaceae bacterium]|nr:DUF1292 domain-containing protein [Erysipelotrichaceae bacterium]
MGSQVDSENCENSSYNVDKKISEVNVITRILSVYPYAWRDIKRLKAILMDLSPEDKLTRNLILASVDEQIPHDLSEKKEWTKSEMYRLSKRLVDSHGCLQEKAEEIVNLWIEALYGTGGMTGEDKQVMKTGTPNIKRSLQTVRPQLSLGKKVLCGTYIGRSSEMSLSVIERDSEWYYIFPTPWNNSLEFETDEEVFFLYEECNNFRFATVVSKDETVSLGTDIIYPLLNTKHDGIVKAWDDKYKTATVTMEKNQVDYEVIIDGVASNENIKHGDKVSFEVVCVSGKVYAAVVRRKQKYRVVPLDIDYINLELENGESLRCSVIVALEIGKKCYIYLLPDGNSNEVFIYRLLSTSTVETTSLMYIETDGEYELAAAEFDKYQDDME